MLSSAETEQGERTTHAQNGRPSVFVRNKSTEPGHRAQRLGGMPSICARRNRRYRTCSFATEKKNHLSISLSSASPSKAPSNSPFSTALFVPSPSTCDENIYLKNRPGYALPTDDKHIAGEDRRVRQAAHRELDERDRRTKREHAGQAINRGALSLSDCPCATNARAERDPVFSGACTSQRQIHH